MSIYIKTDIPSGTDLVLEPSIVGVMPIVYLPFMVDDGKQIIFIHSLWARVPDIFISIHSTYNDQYKDSRKCRDTTALVLFFHSIGLQVHDERGVWRHIERGRETNWRVNLLRRGFIGSFVLEALCRIAVNFRASVASSDDYLELETENRGEFANT